jgi:hypothetical protein
LSGDHQASFSWYQAIVAARPLSKSWYFGSQPSSLRSLPDSIA